VGEVPSSKFQVPSSKFQVPSSKFQVPSSKLGGDSELELVDRSSLTSRETYSNGSDLIRMRQHSKKRILRAAGFILLPLFCLTCLLTCGAVNFMSVSFLTTFEVVNYTGEDLIVTPIGARGAEGERGLLPISRSSRFSIMSSKAGEFPLPAGSTLSVTYDWDDVQFSEIVCRRPDGSHLIVPTGLHPTQNQYQTPPVDRFEIRDLGNLQPATDLHLRAVKSRRDGVSAVHFLAGLGLLSPLCFWLAARLRGIKPPPLPRSEL